MKIQRIASAYELIGDVDSDKVIQQAIEETDLSGGTYDYYIELASRRLGFDDYETLTDDLETERDELALELYREELEGNLMDIDYVFRNFTFPLEIYREISIDYKMPLNEAIRLDDIGVCWAYTEDAAEAHWGRYDEHSENITLAAKVFPEQVDWTVSYVCNVNETSKEEKEIRLNEGTPLTIHAIKRGTEYPGKPEWQNVNLQGKA